MDCKRHPFLAVVASVLIAGACLAAPALAEPVAETGVDVAPEVASDTTTYAFAGLQCAVPGDYLTKVEDGIAIMVNPQNTLSVMLVALDPAEPVPADPEEWGAYFAQYAEAAATSSDSQIVDGWPGTLEDGGQGYVYQMSSLVGEVPVMSLQMYVPMADGSFVTFQLSMVQDEALLDEAELIADSLALATPDAVELSERAASLPQVGAAGGIEIGLPADFALDPASGADEPNWYSADGRFMVGIIPALVEELSAIGVESLDLIASGIAEGLTGTLEESRVIQNGDTVVYLYLFSFMDGASSYHGALGLVPLANDTVTGVLALILDGEGSTAAAETVGEIFGSIQVVNAA